jgi:hypothetical protein
MIITVAEDTSTALGGEVANGLADRLAPYVTQSHIQWRRHKGSLAPCLLS